MRLLTQWLRYAATGVLLLLCGTVAAQDVDSFAPSYEQLVQRLPESPTHQEAQAWIDAAQGRLQQAHAWPNPSIELERANVLGSGGYRGSDAAETTLTASLPIELPSQRQARVDLAHADTHSAQVRAALSQTQLVGVLAQHYVDAEVAIAQHALAQEALALTQADTDAVAALVHAGREPQLRHVQAQAELHTARANVDALAAARDTALMRLGVIAMTHVSPTGLSSSLLQREPGRSNALPTPMQVSLARAEANAAAQQVTLEQRRALPTFSVSVGARRFAESADQAWVVGLGMTVPLFDRNHGGIRAAQAQARAAQARLQASEHNAHAQLAEAQQSLASAQRRLAALHSSVELASQAYRMTRIGVEAGRISQLELRATRAALIAARGQLVQAQWARASAEIALAQVEGRQPFGVSP